MSYSRSVGTFLRRVAIGLLLWFLVVFAVTTAVRLRLSRPTVYIGLRTSTPDPLPLDVGHTRTPVRDARHHEQQVG